MGWPVILTPQARDDLRELVVFIARDSPERARTFGNILVDKALSISAHPEIGRVVPELNDLAVREIVHRSYRIIYEVLHEPDAPHASCGQRGQDEDLSDCLAMPPRPTAKDQIARAAVSKRVCTVSTQTRESK